MRAAVQIGYGDMDSNLRLQEVRAPDPAAGEVIVRVEGSTLNRKDLFALARLTGPGIRQRPPLPHINGTDTWGTIGVSENVIEASWDALVDSLEAGMLPGRVHHARGAAVRLGGSGTPT